MHFSPRYIFASARDRKAFVNLILFSRFFHYHLSSISLSSSRVSCSSCSELAQTSSNPERTCPVNHVQSQLECNCMHFTSPNKLREHFNLLERAQRLQAVGILSEPAQSSIYQLRCLSLSWDTDANGEPGTLYCYKILCNVLLSFNTKECF